MIPIATPELTGNEVKYLQECIKSSYVSSVGPFVDRFEGLMNKAVGSPYSVATSTGTAGLHVALKALGVKRDDIVILPSYTFIASANAIHYCGAIPWFFDIDPTTWTLDINLLSDQLKMDCSRRRGKTIHLPTGRKVSAIMPVYTLGLPANMDKLVPLSKKYKIPIVADAAAAIGTIYNNRHIGDLGADLTVYSFNGNKTVTTGGGGGVSGNNKKLLALVKHLTTTARRGRGYNHDKIGFNYRMTNLAAAVGCAQLEQLDNFIAAKQLIRKRYDAAIAELTEFKPFPSLSSVKGACWFSGVVAPTAAGAKRLQKHLQSADIESRSFWKPIHMQNPYSTAPRTQQPVCEDLWQRVVTLPCSSGLNEMDQKKVIAAIREVSK